MIAPSLENDIIYVSLNNRGGSQSRKLSDVGHGTGNCDGVQLDTRMFEEGKNLLDS